MKYPFVLFFRHDKYNFIDIILKTNSTKLQCTLNITNKSKHINKLYKQTYAFLILFGNKNDYIDILTELTNNNMSSRILHMDSFISIDHFNETINNNYVKICSLDREYVRPIFSIFTTAFNSFDKIIRAFKSLQNQTLKNWEWIIMDDSPNDNNFIFLKKELTNDNRIRIYKRFENNGYIGNVKNEAICLCRGKYTLELDHDDEILPFVLEESARLFDKHSDVGFIYMDFINIYENGKNFWYGNRICKGYGSYYCQKYKNKWVYVYNTPNINNITLSHLVCCPNHPRIWRKDVLLKIGNFSEHLAICDDYEIILRTALNTKIAKIHKMGYIQYMNDNNNNFSIIRNAEINRIGPNYISPIYYDTFDIHNKMKELNAYEDETYIRNHINIWERDNDYKHKYCNLLVNTDYAKQFCIIGIDGLLKNFDRLSELYKDSSNDFIVIDNKCEIEYLWKRLDDFGFDNMKCYVLIDDTEETLIKYFETCYLSTNKYEIITSNINKLKYNSKFSQRHQIINSFTEPSHKYLEIGIEYGYTFSNTHFLHKFGVDPDPKCNNIANSMIFKCTSDEYFTERINNNPELFDVIFIDGMHHCDNVLRDFNNSLTVLTKNGIIFIDDCIPLNYNEQLKIPNKHHYENGILKYDEEWTGEVWKFMYYLLENYNNKICFTYFHNINYRGIVMIKVLEPFTIINEDNLKLSDKYEYFRDFENYVKLLNKIK